MGEGKGEGVHIYLGRGCHMTITCTGALEGRLCEAAGSHNSPGAQGETTRLL